MLLQQWQDDVAAAVEEVLLLCLVVADFPTQSAPQRF